MLTIPTSALAATILGLGWGLVLSGCGKGARTDGPRGAGPQGPFIVDVVRIETHPLRETLAATGTLVALDSVQLQAERPGLVTEILFTEGEEVKAGEVLVKIDDTELRAQLARAEAQLELAGANEARQRDLLAKRGISETEYEQSQANLAIARAETDLVRAQLAKTKIVAPFDGVAGLRQVSVGTYLTTGTTICSFQNIDTLKIDFSIPERYLPYLKTGQSVSFRVAGRAEEFSAKVAAIEPAIDVASRSMMVRAAVPNEGQKLLPGSFAEVGVVLDEIADAILIPPIAMVPGMKQQTVFVHRGGVVEIREVLPGLRTSNALQILSGLAPGDELITTGVQQLRPGMKVEVRQSAAPAVPTTALPAARGDGAESEEAGG
jgi:membrane fusion protein (multidrug efflux system)